MARARHQLETCGRARRAVAVGRRRQLLGRAACARRRGGSVAVDARSPMSMRENSTDRSTAPLGPSTSRASSKPVASSTTSRCAGVPSGRVAFTTVAGRPATVRAPAVASVQRRSGSGRSCAVGSTTRPVQPRWSRGTCACPRRPRSGRRRRRSRPRHRRRSPRPAARCLPFGVVQVTVATPVKSWSAAASCVPSHQARRLLARRRRPSRRPTPRSATRPRTQRGCTARPSPGDAGSPDRDVHRRNPVSGPTGASMLTGSPLSEPCAPCCATTAATLGDTSLRCGTTTIATTAATAAADAAIHVQRRPRCRARTR